MSSPLLRARREDSFIRPLLNYSLPFAQNNTQRTVAQRGMKCTTGRISLACSLAKLQSEETKLSNAAIALIITNEREGRRLCHNRCENRALKFAELSVI